MCHLIMQAWCWRSWWKQKHLNVDDVGYATAAAAGLNGGDLTVTGASVGTKQDLVLLNILVVVMQVIVPVMDCQKLPNLSSLKILTMAHIVGEYLQL